MRFVISTESSECFVWLKWMFINLSLNDISSHYQRLPSQHASNYDSCFSNSIVCPKLFQSYAYQLNIRHFKQFTFLLHLIVFKKIIAYVGPQYFNCFKLRLKMLKYSIYEFYVAPREGTIERGSLPRIDLKGKWTINITQVMKSKYFNVTILAINKARAGPANGLAPKCPNRNFILFSITFQHYRPWPSAFRPTYPKSSKHTESCDF